jgi:uncharacterized protein with PQ loop repeat
MPELSLQNIDQITNDIRNEEISFSHLIEDLIDHVCCDVEFEMQRGLDFIQAYQRVKQKMGSSRRLKEIQEETLYSVDSKYRKMKNTMKFSGIAGTIIFGFAALFKIHHWPMAGVLMTIGAMILAFVFMPSALGVLWKETHSTKKLFLFGSGFIAGFLFIAGTLFKIQHWPVAGFLLLGSVVTAAFLFLPALLSNRLNDKEMSYKRPVYIFGTAGAIFYIMGMFFKIQHWPASSVLMVLGLLILGFIALPWYTRLTWKDETNVSHAFIFIVIGSLLIIVPGALINLNLQSMYDNGYYPHLEQQQRMFEVRQASNRLILGKYQDSLNFKQMQLIDSSTAEVIILIEDIQKQMIEESEGEPGKPAVNPSAMVKTGTGYEIIYTSLSRPFHPQPARDFLMPGTSSRQKLITVMAEYKNFLSTVLPEKDSELLNSLLEPSVFLPEGDTEEDKITMISSLHALEILKNNLLTAESRALGTIALK